MKFDLTDFDGKDVVFVGIGKGRSIAGLQPFLEKYAKLKSFSGVHKQEGPHPLDFLKNYNPHTTIFFKNEAIPGTAMPVPYVTPLQLFFRLAVDNNLTIVGITGTKGKSTTTSLTAYILERAGKKAVLAGNIGISPLPRLAEATPDTVFVLELSSYQLSDLRMSPHISACLNLYNDHTDWHGSLESYWEAKHNIMRYAGPEDSFIYNPDFEALTDWARNAKCQAIAIDPHEQLDLTDAKLYGDHNVLNALFAREIARQFKIPDETTMAAIRQFAPLRHRMQTVAVKQRKTYIDDAIGMTPESTIASLKAIAKSVGPIGCVLLGGQDRGYNFNQVMQTIADQNVPFLVLFPETEEKMKQAMPSTYHPEIFETRSMRDAVKFAAEHAPDNSVVLLSTSAPSYVLWKDFEEKGDQFQDEVNKL